jgi:hypothetical protein
MYKRINQRVRIQQEQVSRLLSFHASRLRTHVHWSVYHALCDVARDSISLRRAICFRVPETTHSFQWALNIAYNIDVQVKVKVAIEQVVKAPNGNSSTLSLTSALDGGGWSTPNHGRFTPGKMTRYPFCRRQSGPHGRYRRVRKISLSPGFDTRTVKHMAVPAHIVYMWCLLFFVCLWVSDPGKLIKWNVRFW